MTAAAPLATDLRAARNPVGTAALVVGSAGVLAGVVTALLQPAVLHAPGGGAQAIGALAAVSLVLRGLLGLAAAVLGLIGVLLPRRRRAAAVVGLTLGGVLVLEVVTGLLVTLLYSVG